MTTKVLAGMPLFVIAAAIGLTDGNSGETRSDMSSEKTKEQTIAWEFSEVNDERAKQDRSYLSFLNVDSMHCGIYHLAAGSKDGQSPHGEDEIYYVESGKSKFHMDGEEFDVQPGTILFVPANKKHYFYDITEDLNLLVFFSKAKP